MLSTLVHFQIEKGGEREVKHYYQALDFLDTLIKRKAYLIIEHDIQILHPLVVDGKKCPKPYRESQNVIKGSGLILYMPPEAKDVLDLMTNLIAWITAEVNKAELALPIIAVIAHYQFATIYPYYDGNGRTERLLTNLVLHRSGYGLKDIYSLEEYYARK